MIRRLALLALVLFAAVPVACAPGLPDGGAGPRVWIDAPLVGSRLALGGIEVVSHASHSGGVGQVELSVAGAVVTAAEPADSAATLVTAYQLWHPEAEGDYTIAVRARNQAGTWGNYAETTVRVIGESAASTAVPVPTSAPTTTPSPTIDASGSPTPRPVAPSTETATPASALPTNTPVVLAAPSASSTPFASPTAEPDVIDTTPPVATATDIAPSATPVPTSTIVPPSATPTATVYTRPIPVLPTSTPTPQLRLPPIVVPTARVLVPLPSRPSFGAATTSVDRFYYDGAPCGPKQVQVSVPVTDPAGVADVRLHLRLAAKDGDAASAWTALPMTASGDTWTRQVEAEKHLPDYAKYANAWVEFYFIATNSSGGTSQSATYADDLTLLRCIVVR